MSPSRVPDDLVAFAGQSEDMITGAAVEDHTWLWVDTVSWDALGGRETWMAFWAEARQEHAGHWDGLLDLDGQWGPLTVALVAGRKAEEASWPNVWDGNHRLGAAAMLERTPGPLVLGVPHDLQWKEVPALQQHFQRPNARARLR